MSVKVTGVVFSSPYGDCTTEKAKCANTGLFSPPCGDRTESIDIQGEIERFSPPYGDGTAAMTKISPGDRFSPPCGDGIWYFLADAETDLFSPPYGDCTMKYIVILPEC